MISASSLAHGRCYHPHEDVVAVKRAMLDAARTKFLMVDHTKMTRRALHAFATLEEFDPVVVHHQTNAEAAEKLGDEQTAAYTPDADASARYDLLYEQYLALHDHFGGGGSDVMPVLRKLQREARGN